MTAFTDDDVTAVAEILATCYDSRPALSEDAEWILRTVAPAIAARAVSGLMDDLMARDEAGEFGECCANPDCRACTVLQHIAVVVAEQVSGDE